MKKFAWLLLLLLTVWVVPDQAHAAAGSKIVLDGRELTAGQDVPVENVNGSVMVPIRMISENLGYSVDWDKSSKTVTIAQSGKTVKLVVGSTSASVDERTVTLNTAPVLRGANNAYTLVPIRFVSQEFGMAVDWDNSSKTVTITTPPPAVPDNTGGSGGNGSVVVPPGQSGAELSKVTGASFSDNRLMIAAEGDFKLNHFKLENNDRIVVDLVDATFSDIFATGEVLNPALGGSLAVEGYPDVSGVRYSLMSTTPYTVRFVIDLNYAKHYDITVTDGPTKLIMVDLNVTGPSAPAPQPGGNGNKLIVLDAGHGAKDPGAKGVTGKLEKDFNLAIVLKTAELLKRESGIDVVLTRSDDTYLELRERAAVANGLNADMFISVHANASTNASVSGTETYYQRDGSKALAGIMQKYLVQATGLSNRGVRYGNFHVIRETKMPAVLLEAGYLSNRGDEALLYTEATQNKIAEGIVKGIKEYFGL